MYVYSHVKCIAWHCVIFSSQIGGIYAYLYAIQTCWTCRDSPQLMGDMYSTEINRQLSHTNGDVDVKNVNALFRPQPGF